MTRRDLVREAGQAAQIPTPSFNPAASPGRGVTDGSSR